MREAVHGIHLLSTLRTSDKSSLILTHAILMLTAWTLLMPIGIFTAAFAKRLIRTKWFHVHWIMQVCGVSIQRDMLGYYCYWLAMLHPLFCLCERKLV